MTIPSSLLALAAVAVALGACGGDEHRWTIEQAEAVDSIRGLHVRVERCRGVGEPSGDGADRRYERFRCLAGARLPGERFDTVAVLYELEPTGSSDYELRRVRFTGGPGIP